MNKPCYFFLFVVAVSFMLTSCVHPVKIDITRRSSDLNNCENIFGPDLKALKLENAILLQTGVIDTADEQSPIHIAIVTIEKKEVVLKLVYQTEAENKTYRIYEGAGYKLSLDYKKETTANNETILKGTFFIEKNGLKFEYDIVGTACNL